MRLTRHFSKEKFPATAAANRSPVFRQRGVALVITLILLSVITFLAITFLALSRREKGSVTVLVDQTTAKNAADVALERVKAEFIANIFATNNLNAFDLLVSTNYQRPLGYDNTQPIGQLQPTELFRATNVNYAYPDGTPLTGNDALQNMANLLFSPRAPVFVTNRAFANSNDFRFYLDLNRNGRYDTNGWQPELDRLGFPIVTISNGIPVTNFSFFIGDPEWIGILERPELPHSSSNRFIARYAYIVIPAGKTLDLNYIHNQSVTLPSRNEGFFRNQGVGSWEINLAAFLVDLNTNMWLVPAAQGGFGSGYVYRTPNGFPPNQGAAFDDAFRLLRSRYTYGYGVNLPIGPNYPLRTVQQVFGGPGVIAFNTDFVDGYSRGPMMTNYWGLPVVLDPDATRTAGFLWSGDDTVSPFFSTQELYDRNRTSIGSPAAFGFTDRLLIAGTNNSSYDRFTFYRMLQQLGTDSEPDSLDRINLNYINTAGFEATNFVSWDSPQVLTQVGRPGSEVFFTNAVNRMLRVSGFKFGVRDIPVYIQTNGGFVYQPSVNRILQLAANIYDSTTNRIYGTATNLPTVFRPIFQNRNGDIYITNFVEVHDTSFLAGANLLSLENTNVAANVRPNDLIFGVPLVIGAKKGLPNFNEFAMQSVFQITRKLEIRRPSETADPSSWRTNMAYIVGLTNIIGVEAWNSYTNAYSRPVDIYVTNRITMHLTNDFGVNMIVTPVIGRAMGIPNATNAFFGFNKNNPNASQSSFVVPLQTNITFLGTAAFLPNPPRFSTNWDTAWDTSQTFPVPQWGFHVTNRLQFMMVDRATGRLVDYVQFAVRGDRDLSAEILDPDNVLGFEGLWSTNRLQGGLPHGFMNQIQISLGNFGGNTADWNGYGVGQPSGTTKDYEIDKFRALFGLSPFKFPSIVITGLVHQVPFTPTKRVSQFLTWQANDPLVHYTAGDLKDLEHADGLIRESLKSEVLKIQTEIGKLNGRYRPWGGNPQQATDVNRFNLSLKDPGISSSDRWEFMTNKFPNVGWLGRVHRGTPWQTVYMKSPGSDLNNWVTWTGNGEINRLTNMTVEPHLYDGSFSQPTNDWRLFEVFTTAFNENATRGRLSINQTGEAAWSAVFSGVVALTNSSTDNELNGFIPQIKFGPEIIEPIGIQGTNAPLWELVNGPFGINTARTNFPGNTFRHLGDVLAAPALTVQSPFLNQSTAAQLQKGINDAVYEWLPQQVMGLLRVGEPRFVVYAYGQTLRPANRSIVTSGQFNGMVTNYQVTAEAAMRAVVRVVGSPDPANAGATNPDNRYPPRIVIESYNLLPPD